MTRILVVGPHPDDQELGMGGTIARLAAQGHEVLLLDMTDGEPTPHGTRETRLVEAEAARAALSPDLGEHPQGKPIGRMLLDLPNRRVEHTLEARHRVAAVIRAWQARVIFVPYFEDAHPDHLAVTRIAEDARFDAKLTKLDLDALPPVTGGPHSNGSLEVGPPIYAPWLIHYYATHLRICPSPSFIFDITGFEGAKRRAIEAYASQFGVNEKNRAVVEWLEASGRYFGSRIMAHAGEPFFCREPLGLASLDSVGVL